VGQSRGFALARSTFVLLMLLGSSIVLLPMGIEADDIPGRPITIQPGTCGQWFPDIWEDRIVYQDYSLDDQADIVLYNITSKTTTRLTSNASDQLKPVIWEDHVVYEYYDGSERDLYLIDLEDGTETRMTSEKGWDHDAAIWEDRVVWIHNTTVKFWTIGSSEVINLTDSTGTKEDLAIYDDRIVWSDDVGGQWEMYIYTISTQSERWFSGTSYDYKYADLYGDLMVYSTWDEDTLDWDAHCINLSVGNWGNNFGINFGPQQSIYPQVFGHYVVYSDNRGGKDDWELYVWDTHDGSEFQLTDNLLYEYGVRLYKDVLVFYSGSISGAWKVYYLRIDRDFDGVGDFSDAFPDNPNEYKDTDGDGIGDNLDEDADGNGVPDGRDVSLYIQESLGGINRSLNEIMYNLSYPTAELIELAKNVSYIRDNLTFPSSLVERLIDDVGSLNRTSHDMLTAMSSDLAGMSSDLASLNTSMARAIDGMGAELMAALYQHNASLHDALVFQIALITHDLTDLDAAVSASETNLTGRLDAVAADVQSLDTWLSAVTADIRARLDGANLSLQSRMASIELSISSLEGSLREQMDAVGRRMLTMEGNLSREHSGLASDLEALSDLLDEAAEGILARIEASTALLASGLDGLDNATSAVAIDVGADLALDAAISGDLARVRQGLIELALNLSEHDRAMGLELLEIASSISLFEEKTGSDLAEINGTLEELQKLGVILGELDALDASLEQAKVELDESVQSGHEEQMGRHNVNMALIVVVLGLAVLVLGLQFQMRRAAKERPDG